MRPYFPGIKETESSEAKVNWPSGSLHAPLIAESLYLHTRPDEHSRPIDSDAASGVVPTVRRVPAAVPAGVAEQGIDTGNQGKGTAPPEELGISGAMRAMKRQS